jgi:hypothetical protein
MQRIRRSAFSTVARRRSSDVYASSFEECDGSEVVGMIADQIGDAQPIAAPSSGRKYIHSVKKGSFVIEHKIEGKEAPIVIVFQNPRQCHPLDMFPSNIFEICPPLKEYLDKGWLEIVDESEIEGIQEKYASKRLTKNDALDQILVDGSVKAKNGRVDQDKIRTKGGDKDDFAIPIDISREKFGGKSDKVGEVYENIKALGIKED